MQGSRTENYIFTVEKCSSLENSLSSPVYAYVSFLLSSTTIYIYIYVGAEQLFHFQQPLFSDPYTVHLVNAFSPTALQPYSSSGIRYPFYRIQQVMFYPKLSKIFISFVLNGYRYTLDSSKYRLTSCTKRVSNYEVAIFFVFFFF